jgi:hypothetical protein
MISVENFNWILYENLLKPVGIDCWYYYPWGTKNNLIKEEFKKPESKRDYNHVLFHFDQEPLWSQQLGPYDLDATAWGNKLIRILANSEKSDLKKQICKSRGLSDWYFFYHGFAALDWYRDGQHIDQQYPIKNAFLSLNHVFDQRSYRLALIARMLDKQIAHKGSISFHTTLEVVNEELFNPDTRLSETSRKLVEDNVDKLMDLPWKLDDVPIDGNLSARFGHQEYKLWQSSLWHLVNETVFYEPKLHLTEKTFKPIVAQRPFILVAAPGNLKYLRSYGFKTFGNWIDESYDDLQDPDQRLNAIADEISRFARMHVDDLRNIHKDMLPVLEYNKQHFFGKFREIIVTELLDNFDQCIRIWNNNRVDGREFTLPDLELVEKILLR